MTYIDYLNDFHLWLESEPLATSAQLLYFKLLNVFSRAGWPEYVRVDTQRLMVMADARTEKTARLARDKLIEAGFIRYEKGRKGLPGAYYLSSPAEKKGVKKYPVKTTGQKYPVEKGVEKGVENDPHIKTKNKNKTITPPPPLAEETGFGADLQAALEDWLAYKAEKRQEYKPTGLRSLISQIGDQAQKHGEKAVADLIRLCMASNWQGIIFDRLHNGQSAPKAAPERQKPGTGPAANGTPGRYELEAMQRLHGQKGANTDG